MPEEDILASTEELEGEEDVTLGDLDDEGGDDAADLGDDDLDEM